MTEQLTKQVADLEPGDVFYMGNTRFTVKEIEAPEQRPMLVRGKVVNVECVAILLDTGNITGWEHFPVSDTVCMISPAQYEAEHTK